MRLCVLSEQEEDESESARRFFQPQNEMLERRLSYGLRHDPQTDPFFPLLTPSSLPFSPCCAAVSRQPPHTVGLALPVNTTQVGEWAAARTASQGAPAMHTDAYEHVRTQLEMRSDSQLHIYTQRHSQTFKCSRSEQTAQKRTHCSQTIHVLKNSVPDVSEQ